MAGKTSLTKTTFSFKKLVNRANTNVGGSDNQELIASNIQLSAQTIFGEAIPVNPSLNLYTPQGVGGVNTVEYVEFTLRPIEASFYDANTVDSEADSGQDVGYHAYYFALPTNYQTLSSNPDKGGGFLVNKQNLTGTLGGLQIVSPSFSNLAPNPYQCKIYSGGNDLTDQISLTDGIDWYVDYFNGVLFVQDYNAAKVPVRAKAFIYVGKMLSASLGSGGSGGGADGVGWIASANGGISTTGSFFLGTNTAVGTDSDIYFSNIGEARFNEQGNDVDFRIETQGKSHALFLDSSEKQVIFLDESSDVGSRANLTDVAFFVSGSIGRTGVPNSKSISLFGGDLVVSGSLTVSGSLIDLDGNPIGTGGSPGGSNTQIQFNNEGSFGGISGATTDGTAVTFGDSGILVGQDITHDGDSDTKITFGDDAIGFTAGGEQLLTISEAGTDMVTVGDGGDVDFRVRTENDDNTLYIEGSTDRIGIGTNVPLSILHVKEAAPTLTLQRENNSNASTINFIGAAANTANSIMHDSSTNDLVFKTFNGSTVEEIMRVGDHYGSPNRQVIFLSGSNIAADDMQPRQARDISFFVSGSIGSAGTLKKGTAAFGGDLLTSGSFHALDKIFLIGSSAVQKSTIESYDSNGSIILSASNGDIKLDAGAGVWRFDEDGTEQLRIETLPDANDIKFLATNPNGQVYFDIHDGSSEVHSLQLGVASNSNGSYGKVGINFQSGGPTNLLDIKTNDTNDQGFTIRNASDKKLVQFSQENVNFGRLMFFDEAGLSQTQISTRPGVHTYFTTASSGQLTRFGIGTRTPSALFDIRGDGQTSKILLLSGSGAITSPDENSYTDLNFFVSGSIGSKDTSTKGTALFGGDLVVSGSIYDASGNKISSVSTTDADGDTKIQVEESADEDKIRFDTAGSERMIIDNVGNVGIGTDSPSEMLHLQSTGKAALFIEADTDNSVETDTAYIKLSQDNAAVTSHIGFAPDNGRNPENASYSNSLSNALLVTNNWSDDRAAVQIGSQSVAIATFKSGSVGIGTNNPTSLLHVNGDANIDGKLSFDESAFGAAFAFGGVTKYGIRELNDVLWRADLRAADNLAAVGDMGTKIYYPKNDHGETTSVASSSTTIRSLTDLDASNAGIALGDAGASTDEFDAPTEWMEMPILSGGSLTSPPTRTDLPRQLFDGFWSNRLDLKNSMTHKFVINMRTFKDFPAGGLSYGEGSLYIGFFNTHVNFDSIKIETFHLQTASAHNTTGRWVQRGTNITSISDSRNISRTSGYAVFRIDLPAANFERRPVINQRTGAVMDATAAKQLDFYISALRITIEAGALPLAEGQTEVEYYQANDNSIPAGQRCGLSDIALFFNRRQSGVPTSFFNKFDEFTVLPGGISYGSGSVSEPTVTFTKKQNSGIYLRGRDDSLNIVSDGKEAVTIDSTGTGVYILSGSGAKTSADESAYPDVNFFVSGSIGSRNTSVKGTALLGGDVVVSGSIISTHILPRDDKLYNLGGPRNRFANIYTGDLHLRNERGNWTIVEERDFLTVINNHTGKKFKMVLEPFEE